MELVNLLEVAPYSGSRVKPFQGAKRYLATGSLVKTRINFENVTFDKKPSRASIEVRTGDIIFAKMKSTNKVLLIDESLSGIIVSSGFSVHRCKDELNPQYLNHILKHDLFLNQKDKFCTGAIQPAITNKGIKKIKIPCPLIDDQKKIAKLLSDCDNLLQKRKESIELLDEFLQSTFLEMFGPKNKNYSSWSISKVEQYAMKSKGSMRTGPFGSDLLHGEFSGKGDVCVIGIDNVVKNTFEWGKPRFITFEKFEQLKRYQVFPNDVLISIMATNGRSAVVPNNIPVSINSKHLAAITLDESSVLPYYLKYAFEYHPLILKQLSKNMKGAIMDGLNLTIIKNLKLPKPPIATQEIFTKIVFNQLKLKGLYTESLEELRNLYGSLSQKAFKGELDLSKVDISDMEDSKKKDIEEMKEDILEKELDELMDSFEHTLPTGEVPSNRKIDIKNLSIREYLGFSKEAKEENHGIEFNKMDKDYFYQFILKDGFQNRTFTLPDIEEYARRYILKGTGFEFTYENWKTIVFRFIGAKQPIIEQQFDKDTKTIKLKLTDEAFKV